MKYTKTISRTLENCTTPGDYMRYSREAAGYTLADLSAACGIGMSTLRNWERGRGLPTIASAIRVADALFISIDEYVGHKTKE